MTTTELLPLFHPDVLFTNRGKKRVLNDHLTGVTLFGSFVTFCAFHL